MGWRDPCSGRSAAQPIDLGLAIHGEMWFSRGGRRAGMREPNLSARAPTTDRPHVPVLDGARGLAILLVLVFHFGCMYDRSELVRHWWLRLFAAGWCGVDLFFVLSGCLITGILIDAKGGPGYFRNFYARRALRIFPLYYGFLVVMFLTRSKFPLTFLELTDLDSARPWLRLYGQNFWVMSTGRWLPPLVNHLWSLAVEEQFYIAWPLVVWLCSRRGLAWVCGGVLAGCLALRVALTLAGVSPMVAYVFTLTRLDGFAAGGLVALALRGNFDAARLRHIGRGVALACLAGVAAMYWRHGFYLGWHDSDVQTVGYGALAVGFAGLLLWAVNARPTAPVSRALTVRPLRWLAKYSYGIYVWHFPVTFLLEKYVGPDRLPAAWRTPPDTWFRLAMLAAGSAIAIGLGVLSWHLYEKHFLRLKNYFPQTGVPTEQPAVVTRRAA
jgi:peptidoglycan/LPS O-acetylase OafA/YrhL